MLLCYKLYKLFVLLFVVVTYLTAGANKTSFVKRARFNVGSWQIDMLKLLRQLREGKTGASAEVITLVNTLKTELEYQDALSPENGVAQLGETFLFDGRDLHWGNACKDLRFVVYSQAVHRGLLDKFMSKKSLVKTVLTTYYSAEYVVDRRTIASPAYLHDLWLYGSSDVREIEEKNIGVEARKLWEKLASLDSESFWPLAVCQCCLKNDVENMVQCTNKECWMGAIHTDCKPIGVSPEVWKCSSCLMSNQ